MTDLTTAEHPILHQVGGAVFRLDRHAAIWAVLDFGSNLSRCRSGRKLSHFSGRQYAKICFWKHFKWELGNAVTESRFIFDQQCQVWQLDRTFVSQLRWVGGTSFAERSSHDYVNLDKANPSFIHWVARSPPLLTKWIEPVDLRTSTDLVCLYL